MNETIADIVSEMRSNEFDDPRFNVYSLVAARTLARGWADRIEAAVNQPVTNCNRLGNAAKMRDALKQIHDRVNSLDEDCGVDPIDVRDLARAALSAPPRNCDRFATLDDARNAFFADYVPDETCSSATAFATWLFDEAKGDEE